MEPLISAVHGKARAFVEALARLPRNTRTAVPSGQFARDYNALRELALEAAPGIDKRLLGDFVGVCKTPSGEFSQASYVEIEVYARQVMEQLALLQSSPAAGPCPSVNAAETTAVPMKAYRVNAIRQEFNQAYSPWRAEEDEDLRSRYLEGATLEDLVQEFRRQPGGIRSRLRKLGLGLELPVDSSCNPTKVLRHNTEFSSRGPLRR